MNGARQFCASLINNKCFFVTTPIYYVNAAPHLGHLYSSVVADFTQRWHRLCGDRAVVLSTGTDEHGTKIQLAAQHTNSNIYNYCTDISHKYSDLCKTFDINYTNFIRTTDSNHKVAVREFWNTIDKGGFIYLSQYEGWYCVSDETFLSNSQLKEQVLSNGDKVLVSADSGHPVEWTQEQNYMFRLSKFQNDLKYWLQNNENCIRPKKFHRQLLEMVDSDVMNDVSISRPTSRVHWGIPVPGRPDHTVYVWMDALVNYLTVAGYPNVDSEGFKKSWPPCVQVIGKDILKFHGIYWPAFLMAANLEPPKTLLCHSHWTVDGKKMSKSRQNVVCPFEKAQLYTSEGLRYFLLREGTLHSDANYSDLKVKRILNSELADTFGNLLSRCCGKALNPEQEFPKLNSEAFEKISKVDCTKILLESLQKLPDIVYEHYNEFNCYKAIDAIIATLHNANEFLETMKPWQLKKSPSSVDELQAVIHVTMETLRVCGILLQPVIPHLSSVLLNKIAVDVTRRRWKDIRPFSWQGPTQSRTLSKDSTVLFKKIIINEKTKNKIAC